MKKLSNNETELKKVLLIKTACILIKKYIPIARKNNKNGKIVLKISGGLWIKYLEKYIAYSSKMLSTL